MFGDFFVVCESGFDIVFLLFFAEVGVSKKL